MGLLDKHLADLLEKISDVKEWRTKMSEYIDKDVVLELVDEYACENKIYLADLYKCIADMIKEIVSPVVHCKDCRYRLDCSMNNFYYCSWHKSFVEENSFCSYGRNKLEDQK